MNQTPLWLQKLTADYTAEEGRLNVVATAAKPQRVADRNAATTRHEIEVVLARLKVKLEALLNSKNEADLATDEICRNAAVAAAET